MIRTISHTNCPICNTLGNQNILEYLPKSQSTQPSPLQDASEILWIIWFAMYHIVVLGCPFCNWSWSLAKIYHTRKSFLYQNHFVQMIDIMWKEITVLDLYFNTTSPDHLHIKLLHWTVLFLSFSFTNIMISASLVVLMYSTYWANWSADTAL